MEIMKENKNSAIYNRLWEQVDVIKLNFGPSWEIIRKFQNKKMLEIGPGHFPRIPIKKGYFVDVSRIALEQLQLLGGQVFYENKGRDFSFFPEEFFDLVVAWDVLEHIENDKKTLKEVYRILKNGGYLLIAVPIRMAYFGPYDFQVGHQRRYELEELERKFAESGFKIVKWRAGGFLSWLYSFSFARSCGGHLSPHMLVDKFPRVVTHTIIKWAILLEQLTHSKWQKKPLLSIKNKRLTRLEIIYKKCD